MKKCLWVVPKLIFPVLDGARVANQSLIQSMRPHFEHLDIIIYKEVDETNLHLELYHEHFRPDKIHVLVKTNISKKLKKFFNRLFYFLQYPALPVTTSHYASSVCKKQIKKIMHDNSYDVLVFDGLHPFAAFLDLEREGRLPPIVYRAHNVEHELISTAAENSSNPIKRLLYFWQAQKMELLEKKIIEKSKKVWAIANEDQIRFTEMTGKDNISYVPVGLNFIKEKILEPNLLHTQKVKLLFVGKMDWGPNKDGLRWFLHEIWPFVDHHKLEIKIIGGGNLSWVESFYSFPGVRFLGFVADLAPFYEEADYSIIPIRFGSGTRIKVIESISHGVPIISTPVGVQGSELEEGEYIKATDSLDWIRTLNALEPEHARDNVRSAFIKLEKAYSPEMIGENAYHSLQT